MLNNDHKESFQKNNFLKTTSLLIQTEIYSEIYKITIKSSKQINMMYLESWLDSINKCIKIRDLRKLFIHQK